MSTEDPFVTPAQRGRAGLAVDENGIARDQWGRPVIEGVGHTRATTLARTLADEFGLTAWKLRKLAYGLTIGADDLISLASVTDPNAPGAGRIYESEIIEPALDRAGANAGRKKGTALHSGTHRVDAGTPIHHLPLWMLPSLEAYCGTMTKAGVTIDPAHIEIFTVAAEVGTAGTADRLLGRPDWPKLRVGDLKTQKDHPETYNALEIAIQLAVYAHGLNERGIWRPSAARDGSGTWDTSTVGRVDLEAAVIMWLPVIGPNAGRCELIEVDIAKGWILAKMAERIRAERKAARSLVRPLRLPALTVPALAPSPEQRTADRIDSAFPLDRGGRGMGDLIVSPEVAENLYMVGLPRPATLPTEDSGNYLVAATQDATFPLGQMTVSTEAVPAMLRRSRRSSAQVAAARALAEAIAAGCACPPVDEHLGVPGPVVSGCPMHGQAVRAQGRGISDEDARLMSIGCCGGFVAPDGSRELCSGCPDTQSDEITAGPTPALVTEYGLTQNGVAYRVTAHNESGQVVSECVEDGSRHTPTSEGEAARWRARHASEDHPHDLLEAAQRPISGPGIDAALATSEGTGSATLARLAAEPSPVMDPVIVLRAQVRKATTPEELSKLWREHAGIWTDELTQLGQKVLAAAKAAGTAGRG